LPGTSRSKVGCEAIDDPCTKRIVPLGAEGWRFRQRKSRISPSLVGRLVQCSVPFIERLLCKNTARGKSLEEDRNVRRSRGPGYVSQAADAPRQGARDAACIARKGPRHLADLDLAAVRRRSARARQRA